MRDDEQRDQDVPACGAAGASDEPGKPFDPSAPAEDEGARDETTPVRSVPIHRPVSEEAYTRLKQDADHGPPTRRRNVQQDR